MPQARPRLPIDVAVSGSDTLLDGNLLAKSEDGLFWNFPQRLHLSAAAAAELPSLKTSVHGKDEAQRWLVRWRVFFMACAELFGFAGGSEWLVSHDLFENAAAHGIGGQV